MADVKDINIILEFLNGLASQLAEKMEETGDRQNQQLISELQAMVGKVRDTISQNNELPQVQIATSPMMSQIKQFKLEVPQKIEIPKFPEFPKIPDFPKEISVKEAKDIVNALKLVVTEIQNKDTKFDFSRVEKKIGDLQSSLEKQIKQLQSAIPEIPSFDVEIPMENGRIPVVLPDSQVAKMGGGQGGGSGVVIIKPGTTVGTIRKTVTSAGTAEQLPANACKKVYIQALQTNTDAVAIGDENVVAASASGRGLFVFPTQSPFPMEISDTSLLYVDSRVSGEGITVFFYQ